MRDVLPSRANNSANDQDSVQVRILEVVRASYSRVRRKKASFSTLAFDQVTPLFSPRCGLGKLEQVTACRRIVWTIKGNWSPTSSIFFSFTARGSRRAVLARIRIMHLLFRRRQRTLPFYNSLLRQATRVNASLAIMFPIWRWELWKGLLSRFATGSVWFIMYSIVIYIRLSSKVH